jgi:hypothetical protein
MDISAEVMQKLMQLLANTAEDWAAELHDDLVNEGFSRLEKTVGAEVYAAEEDGEEEE